MDYSDFQKTQTDQCRSPAKGPSRWDQGLSAAEMKRCRWLKPVIVCQESQGCRFEPCRVQNKSQS